MAQTTSKGTPERAKTDKHLHKERRNADEVLAEQKAAVEGEADRVIELARENADTVLSEARDKADDKLQAVKPVVEVRAVIETERKIEDRVVEQERAIADENLRREREQNARDLLALLPYERISTDRSLQTERVRADAALSNRDEFLGMVSHDLRDLLGGIVSCSTMLLRTADGEASASTRTGAERIQRLAARMKRLIDDLTDVTSIDAGKLSVMPVPGNLAPVISEAVTSMLAAATAKNISLKVPHSEGPLPAKFDAGRTLQVLTNLIANAIKFTPAGGEIRVHSEQSDDSVRVSVTDSGQGVPPDLLEAIFERFRQASVSDRRGLGLGLYISRCLVEAQHGKIWAESTLGQGTTVSFTLPK